MKKNVLLLLFLTFFFSNCSQDYFFKANDRIYFKTENYDFIIWLVNDLKLANELWREHDKSLMSSTTVTSIDISESITPFIIFRSKKSEKVDIDILFRSQSPDGSYIEYNDAHYANIFSNYIERDRYYKNTRNVVMGQHDDAELGIHTIFLTIKVNQKILKEIELKFELTDTHT